MSQVLLINLDRSADRLARCVPMLEALGLPWERVPGVDGRAFDSAHLGRLNPQPAPADQWFRPLTSGEVGCFLSHLRCWQIVIERDLAWALVLEDDFELLPDFSPACLRALGETASQWDVLKLTRLRQGATTVATLHQGMSLKVGGTGPDDCTAYLVSRRGAAKLVQHRQHLYRPVDFDMKHHWERGLSVLWSSPSLFHQAPHEVAPTIIGERTAYRRYPLPQRLMVYLRKHRYQVLYWLADTLKLGRRRLQG